MRAGDIEQIGSPMEIYSDPATDFVADFFGSPSMNLIRGEIVGENGALRFRSPRIRSPLPKRSSDDTRPGNPRYPARAPARAARRRNGGRIELPVRLIEPLGKDTLLYFDIGAERPLIAVSEGLSMAETGWRQAGADLTRECMFLFGPEGGGSPWRRLCRPEACPS